MPRHKSDPRMGHGKHRNLLPFVPSTRSLALATTVCTCALAGSVSDTFAQEGPEWSELRTLIEVNATDGDAGFQVLMDGDDWVAATIRDPDGKKIYQVNGGGAVSDQGLTENFFESAEPDCSEPGASLADVLGRFPEGVYDFSGRSVDNEPFDGEAALTHSLPAVPTELAAVTDNSVRLEWSWPGAMPGLGNCPDLEMLADLLTMEDDLFGFQIVVGSEFDPLFEFIIELPSDAREVIIPDGYLEGDADYKFEVVAIGAGADPETPDELDNELRGNQTIAEQNFSTTPGGDGVSCSGDECED